MIIMNRRFFSNSVLMGSLLALLISVTSCVNNEKKVETDGEQATPDAQISSIDALADNLVADLWDDDTPEEMAEHYKSHNAAVKSYWAATHQGEDESKMNEEVCLELKALADSLSGDNKVRSADISCALARYQAAQEYCTKYGDNPLYQAEMRDWLELEDELADFYRDLAQLANWEGPKDSAAGSTLARLLQLRCDDYCGLKSGDEPSDGEIGSVAEARANLIQELEDAKALPDDLVDEEEFRAKLKDMRESADKLVALLDKWMASRAKLCEAEKIPESRAARLIGQLGNMVMELIEG